VSEQHVIAQTQPVRTLVVNYHYDEYDVLITRGTPFGNQNPITFKRTRKEALDLHFLDMCRRLLADPGFHDAIMALEGKRLGCVCRPMDCHGDFYVRYITTARALMASFPQLTRESLIKAVLSAMRSNKQ
jgi:hypothetical protein